MDFKPPNKIIVFKNKDKDKYKEHWYANRNLSNFPKPFRMLILAPPSRGKTNLIKNILLHTNPEFDNIYLMHTDLHGTKEYDDIETIQLEQVPEIDEFDRENRNLLILDDFSIGLLGKDDLHRLQRLFSYVSTHRNLSIIITSQDLFSQQHNARFIVRYCNVFILYKIKNLELLGLISKRLGLKKEDTENIFKEHIKTQYDFLVIDDTENTPALLRKNLFDILELID